ncbi:MAG: hypothetical protein N2D54_03310 [Chloroflexota bacterium]
MKRVLLFLTIILAACGPTEPQPNQNPPAPSATPAPTSTPAPLVSQPDDSAAEDIANLQATVESALLSLTASANQAASLQSQVDDLQSQIDANQAVVPIVSGSSSTTGSGASTSGGGGTEFIPTPTTPANVIAVKVKVKANLREIAKYTNNKPVMEIYEPRIQFAPGEWILVYKPAIVASDGEELYPVYSPRGRGLYIRVGDTNRP